MAVSVKIDDDMKARVQRLADQKQRSSHWVMREAIEEYVTREETREDFHREAMRSWAEYQETGKHLTGDEVRSWLATWGTEAEQALPECHD